MAEPRSPLEAAEVAARRLGRDLKKQMPPGWGFVLLVSSLGRGGFSTWVSSMERADTVRVLEEFGQTIAGTMGMDRTAPCCWLCDGTALPLVTFVGPNRSVKICNRCIMSKERPT